MKQKLPIIISAGLLLGAIILGLALSRPAEHDPRDLGTPVTTPAESGNGFALTAAQATELAEKLANDRAEAVFQCRPFYDSPPARSSSSGWSWESRCGHRLVDFEAKVTFGRDGGNADVKLVVLDSRAVDAPVQRLR